MGTDLLAELRAVGLRVWLRNPNGSSGEFTIMVAPRDRLPPDMAILIALQREALIDALYAEHWDRVFPAWS